jgi:O-antigen/teichoic acid export membrane protein
MPADASRPPPTPPPDAADAGDDTSIVEAATAASAIDPRKGGWIVAARVVSQAAQFLTMLVAARIMEPAEFGIFALVSALAIGMTRVSEAGWREYVMSVDDPAAAAQANVLALACGTLSLVAGLVVGASLRLLGNATVAGVMALMAIWVLLTTLAATQSGILVKRNQLRPLAVTQIAGEAAGFLAALATFAWGGGIFGLVASRLGMQAVVMGLSLAVTRWFPLVAPRREAARAAYLFSRRILVTRLIGFAQENVSILVIGALVGPAGAGLFRAAGRFGSALYEVVSEPVRVLAWSTLRPDAPGPAANHLLRLTIIVATPLFIGLAMVADDVVASLLGPGWAASAPLLVAFSLAGWLSTPNMVTEPLLVMRGRIDLVPRLSFAIATLHLVVLVVVAPFGTFWIAVGQTVAAAATLPVILRILRHKGGVSLRELGRQALPALVGATLLIAAVSAVRMALPADTDPAVRLAIEVTVGALAYLVVIATLVPRQVWTFEERVKHVE